MFPKHGRNVIINKNIRTAFDAVSELYDQGYRKVNMVVGSDRVESLILYYKSIMVSRVDMDFITLKVLT